MTSEAAAFNQGAVALAADSAVTMTMVGQKKKKVLRTANKLFALSATQPIAVMFYGNDSLMDIPWETIIKCYRKQLGDRFFDRVGDYAEDFFSYTSRYFEHVATGALEVWVREQVAAILGSLQKAAEEAEKTASESPHRSHDLQELANDPSLSKEIIEATAAVAWEISLREIEDKLENCAPFNGVSAEMEANIKRFQTEAVDHFLNGGAKPFDETLCRRLHRIGHLSVSRYMDKVVDTTTMTGVVVAGFGDAEVYPSIRDYQLPGLLIETGACWALDCATDLAGNGELGEFRSGVHLYGQRETAAAFMTGIDPFLAEKITSSLVETLEWFSAKVLEEAKSLNDSFGEELDHKMEGWCGDLERQYIEELVETQQQFYTDGIIEMIAMLPRLDLAAAAESLVRMEAFKHRVTMGHETVSEPLDVVVISKGDGLVWVRRKDGGTVFDMQTKSEQW